MREVARYEACHHHGKEEEMLKVTPLSYPVVQLIGNKRGEAAAGGVRAPGLSGP